MASFVYGALVCVAMVMLMTGSTHGWAFCLQQEQIFSACSSRMESAFLKFNMDLDLLCSELLHYLTCVQDTNWTCPAVAIFKDRVFRDAVDNARNYFKRYCPSFAPKLGSSCSHQTVSNLMQHCIRLVDKVQEKTPRDRVCKIQVRYLNCLERATKVCHSDPLFLSYNVPQAVASTKAYIKSACNDEMQADDSRVFTEKPPTSSAGGRLTTRKPKPTGRVTPERKKPTTQSVIALTTTTNGRRQPKPNGTVTMKWNKPKTTESNLCSERNAHNEMNKCSLHLEQPPEVMDREGCRYQRNFLQCLNRLMRNCPAVAEHFDTVLAVSQETFDILCSHVKCPSDVIDNKEDIVSFCMKDFEDSSPSTGDYCRKLTEVPKCIEKIRPICPPHLEAYRVDGALSMLQTMLKQNCNVKIG